MPQASDKLRAKFPGIDAQAIKELEEAGYKLTREFTWVKPTSHKITDRENDALDYLFHEWDYGDVEK